MCVHAYVFVPHTCIDIFFNTEHPTLKPLEVTSSKGKIIIHYKFDAFPQHPVLFIAWDKDNNPLTFESEKYEGGKLSDPSLIINSPTKFDSGTYTCSIANAAGHASESVKLKLGNAF